MDPSATRVLIVDDDRDISALLSALMNKEGLTNMMAHDGETALQMVPVARPDMLLVDVKMPGIDGMDRLEAGQGNRPPSAGGPHHRLCRDFRLGGGHAGRGLRLSGQTF